MASVTIDVAYLESLVARASYVDFKVNDLVKFDADGRKLVIAKQLEDSEIRGAGWSKTDAETFAQHFDVLSMSPREQNSWSNGFSATLLQDRETGMKVLAPRGTEFPTSGDMMTNVGIAANPIPDNFRFWNQYQSLEGYHAALKAEGLIGTYERGDIKVIGERDVDSAVRAGTATTATHQTLDLTNPARYTAALFIGDSAFST